MVLFGDREGFNIITTDNPNKGKFDGNCNRTACQAPIKGANWFNMSTRAYYCTYCARTINRESMRFDCIDMLIPVDTPDNQPPFPYDEMRRRQNERRKYIKYAKMVEGNIKV